MNIKELAILLSPDKSEWKNLATRSVKTQEEIFIKVREILDAVKNNGDSSLKQFTEKFDHVRLGGLSVSSAQIQQATDLINSELKAAIQIAKNNIEKFHRAQKSSVVEVETMPGVTCWQKDHPIEKVGIYIPGGTAPLFSTVLMLAIPAKLAGCEQIVLCTPPTGGQIHPAILYTANLCGVTEIYQVGGAQAIAAMAYGTESIPQVYKIFGPGNQYVNVAKQMVAQEGVAIDLPAGPTELAIFADETGNPEFIAADFLSQIEHGKDSQVVMVTTSKLLIPKVLKELESQASKLDRQEFLLASLKNSRIIYLSEVKTCFEFLNFYAPEHLIIASEDARNYLDLITTAGSVFVGNYTPESAGDYASGTNHTLPTNFAARAWSGVNLGSFTRKITYQEITKEGIQDLAAVVSIMAEAEGLVAHSNAAMIRVTGEI